MVILILYSITQTDIILNWFWFTIKLQSHDTYFIYLLIVTIVTILSSVNIFKNYAVIRYIALFSA